MTPDRVLLITPRDGLVDDVRAALRDAEVLRAFPPRAGQPVRSDAYPGYPAWEDGSASAVLVDLAWAGACQHEGGVLLCRLREDDPDEGRAIIALVPRGSDAGLLAINAAADDLLFDPLVAAELRWRLALARRRQQRISGLLSVKQYHAASLDSALDALPLVLLQFQINAARKFRLRFDPGAFGKLGLEVPDALDQRTLARFVADVDRARIVEGLTRAIGRDAPWSDACELTDAAGNRAEVRLFAVPEGRDAAGVATWSALILDVSEQRGLEHRVERATSAARTRDAILRTMSHELRTPLTAILGMCQVLLDGGQSPGGSPLGVHALGVIEQSGHRLLGLIDDVLELSRLASGDVEPLREMGDLTGLTRRCVDGIETRAAEGGLRLTVALDRVRAPIDPATLERAILALLDNAVRFTAPGGEIRVALGEDGEGRARLVVADSGVGIQPERARAVFAPFVQADMRYARQFEGAGLGLAIVARAAALHGGSVQAESTPGDGTRMTLTLPLRRADEPVPAPGLRRRVLIADGQASAVRQLAGLLAAQGHEVHTAHDPVELLASVRERTLDLILLSDPFGGEDAAEVLAALPAGAPPVVLLPTIVTAGDTDRWQAAGAAAVQPPPLTAAMLGRLVEQCTIGAASG